MKFIEAEDNVEAGLYQRMISDDNKIEMGIYPVLFGYRIRAGYVGDCAYHIDWCAGNDQKIITLLYSILKNILESGFDMKKLPGSSAIKPFYNDVAFTSFVNSLVVKPLDVIQLKPVQLDRIKLINSI